MLRLNVGLVKRSPTYALFFGSDVGLVKRSPTYGFFFGSHVGLVKRSPTYTLLRRSTVRQSGFTLLELLVVLVVMGVMLGMVTMNAMPNKKQALQGDAQRIALLLQMAREEAIVRNRPVAFEVDSEQFRFYIRGDSGWELLNDNDLFRERRFKNSPLVITMQPSPTQSALPMKIIFGREPVDKPFVLTLAYEDASVSIQADGLGHFTVE